MVPVAEPLGLEAPARTGVGEQMHSLMRDLFPITRSIAGPGFRQTLDRLAVQTGPMERHRFPTGERVHDWTVPQEWELREAWIRDPQGRVVLTSAETNLHVVSHSRPVRAVMPLEELQKHLHSLPDQPEAIPYRTTYYAEGWGFCLSERVRSQLEPGDYEVVIDADLRDGRVEVGEVVIEGRSSEEVLFSTYCCHPSMANNELSGPAVLAFLARRLRERGVVPRLTYRFVFAPETIGTIAYLSKAGRRLLERLMAGYVITCVGTPFPFNYKHSRREGTLADRVAEHVLAHSGYAWYGSSFYPGRSDERQYCSPGYNLPVGSLARVDWASWSEYHTSLDDLEHVRAAALEESLSVLERIVDVLEGNERLAATVLYGEPQLGRRGLYPRVGGGWQAERNRRQLENQMFLLNFCDGATDLLTAAERWGRPVWELREAAGNLIEHDLLRRVESAPADH
jgi:aminopeptidase-like protein